MQIVDALTELFNQSNFVNLPWQNWVMILISFVLFYFAIVKKFEPLLLIPIAFGMLLVNIYPEIMADPTNMSFIGDNNPFFNPDAHWYDSGVLRLIYPLPDFRRERSRDPRGPSPVGVGRFLFVFG